MKLIDKIKKFFNNRKRLTFNFTAFYDFCTSSNCEDVILSIDTLKEVSIVKSVINKISTTVSTLQINIYDKNDNYVTELKYDSNSLQNIIKHLLVYGYCYYEIKILNNKYYFEICNNLNNNVIEIKNEDLNLNNLINRFGIYLSHRLILTENYLNRYIRHGSNFGLITINSDKDLPFIGIENIEMNNELKSKFLGNKNLFNIKMLPYDIKYTEVISDFTKSGLLELLNKNREDVCNSFNIPSVLLNDNKNSTYNNLAESYKRYYSECVFFYADLITDSLNKSLFKGLKAFGENSYIYYNKKKYLMIDSRDKLISQLNINYLIENNLINKNELKDILFY